MPGEQRSREQVARFHADVERLPHDALTLVPPPGRDDAQASASAAETVAAIPARWTRRSNSESR